MKTITQFQWLAFSSDFLRLRSLPTYWRMGLLLMTMAVMADLDGFAQGGASSSTLLPSDFEVTLTENSVGGNRTYTVKATLLPNRGYSGTRGWNLTLRLKLLASGIVLSNHVGATSFDSVALVAHPSYSGPNAWDAYVHCESAKAWNGTGQPWVSWTFSVAGEKPLIGPDPMVTGLVQVVLIEGLRMPYQIAPLLAEPSISVYPNPCRDEINVRIGEEGFSMGQLEVTNASGMVVATVPIGEMTQVIDLSALPSGFYFLHLLLQRGQAVKPVLLQKM